MGKVKKKLGQPKKELSKYIHAVLFVGLICLPNFAFALKSSGLLIDERECLAISASHISHDIAISQLMLIAEVQLWDALVIKNNRHVSTISDTNNTVFNDGQCFWEINLYEVADGQFLRWNAYRISLNKPLAYRVDDINPVQLVPVKIWSNKQ